MSNLRSSIIESVALTVHRYGSKPIIVETRRWDPVTGGASSVLSTAVDLGTSVTGIFTEPYTEYRDDRDRRAYDESTMSASRAAKHQTDTTSEHGKITNSSSVISVTKRKPISAGQMASASGKSIAMFAPKALKGMTVDIPLAITDGLKNIPRVYGETPRDHGPITDFTSGATVAGKTFAWGFYEGITDIVVKPYQGAQREGVKGAAKGVGKGLISMTTKTGAGMFGLMGYTGAGIAKSLRNATHAGTRRRIAEARHAEGQWLLKQSTCSHQEVASIGARFQALKGRS